jgi:hypothetical protein
MGVKFRTALACFVAFGVSLRIGYSAFADPVQVPVRTNGFSIVLPARNMPKDFAARVSVNATGTTALPLWNYSATAAASLGGSTYTGTMVGRSPFDNGKTTTTIPVQIIPLIITITDTNGAIVYDPTLADSCVPGSLTDVAVVTGSPIFTNNAWTMNGVGIGTTQYIDAFQRAEFWSSVGNTPYHLILSPTTLAAQHLTFGTGGTSGIGANYSVGCSHLGVVQNTDLDNAVYGLLTGALATQVNPSTFPVFLLRNVVSTTSGTSDSANCCILGYHSGYYNGSNLQIYSPFSLDTIGAFGTGYVSTLSHEMGEAINDPIGTNPTPTWGNIGQVQGGSQNNLEVGDPLSGSVNFTVTGANGLTYKMQELAFYSWFYGGTSLGAGGKFSNNGTFNGNMKLYPPGGTN